MQGMNRDPISFLSRIKAYFEIIRILDDFIIGLGLIVALVLSGTIEKNIPLEIYLYAFVAGFFVSAHAMVVNDIIDVEIDKINEPDRILPSNRLTKQHALIYSLFLGSIGVLFFGLIDLSGLVKYQFSWLFGLLHVLLADVYNLKLKKIGIIGNFVVAYTSYSIFLYADLFFNGEFTLLTTSFGIMAFLTNYSREIIKEIIDEEGDNVFDVKSIVVLFGSRFTKFVAMSFLILTILVGLYIFPEMGMIGKTGIVLFSLLFSYIIIRTKDVEDPQIARTVKFYILWGPLLLSPFLIFDQLFYYTYY